MGIFNNNKKKNRIQRRYLTFLQSPYSTANCLQHVRSSGPGAIVCKSCATQRVSRASAMLRATWYEGTAQLLSLTELKPHIYELYFIG